MFLVYNQVMTADQTAVSGLEFELVTYWLNTDCFSHHFIIQT